MVNATLTDRDLCAARALLRWTQNDLAERAKVPIVYIRRFERGEAMKERHLESVIDTLREAGVVLFGKATIDGGSVVGGVALKRSATPKAPFEKRVYSPRPVEGAGTAPAAAAPSIKRKSEADVRKKGAKRPLRRKA